MLRGGSSVAFSVFIVLATLIPAAGGSPHSGSVAPPSVPATYLPSSRIGDLPLSGEGFTANVGQLPDPEIRFYADAGGMLAGFTPAGVLIVLRDKPDTEPAPRLALGPERRDGNAPSVPIREVLVRITFPGAARVNPVGRGELPARSNFFLGSDPARWRTGVRSYSEVVYAGLYDGVDVVYRIGPQGLKYDLVVRAGADPSAVAFAYEGLDSLQVENGDLVFGTPLGELRDRAPTANQDGRPVPCGFALRGLRSHGFRCTGVDPARGLVIDPVLYASYLGGPDRDGATSVGADASDHGIVGGVAWTPNFPSTPGAFMNVSGGWRDGSIAKFDLATGALLYSTFLGGSGDDRVLAIAVEANGDVVIAGDTTSTDFPVTPGAYDTTYNPVFPGNGDVIVAKLDATGASLVFSTYLGGTVWQMPEGIALDAAGNSVVTGSTESTNFPLTPGAYDSILRGFAEGFITVLDATGTSMLYSTFLGGTEGPTGADWAISAAFDGDGVIWACGLTDAPDLPVTPNAYQTTLGGYHDAWLAILDPSGSRPPYVTYIGGSGYDDAWDLALAPGGRVYIAGETNSTDLPLTPDAFQNTFGGAWGDAFFLEFDPGANAMVYATLLGGSVNEEAFSVSVDAGGTAYVTGWTSSPDFPTTPGAIDTVLAGEADAFIAIFDPGLRYSTLLGGSGFDGGAGIAALGPRDVLVAGSTNSADLPVTSNAYDSTFNGGLDDTFVAEVLLVPSAPVTSLVVGQPNVTASVTYVTSATPLGLIAYSAAGLAIAYSEYRIDQGSWTLYASPFSLSGDGIHLLEFRSADVLGSLGPTNRTALAVDDTPPASTILVGSPSVVGANTWVTSSTPLEISANETTLGNATFTNRTRDILVLGEAPYPNETFPEYLARVNVTLTREIWPGLASVSFRISSTSCFDTDLGVFLDANRDGRRQTSELVNFGAGPTSDERVTLPNPAPGSYIVAIAGFYEPPGGCLVDAEIVEDFGGPAAVGPARTEYRVRDAGVWGSWQTYQAPFTLSGADGPRTVEYRSQDRLGNLESARSVDLILDNTPPATTIAPANPPFTTETQFNLTATDDGCGVARTEYRIDGGSWTPYSTAFTLPEGDHVIGYRSVDRLNNTETEHTLAVTITGTTELPVEFNWKPFVALVFSLLLALAGVWSSRRAPWRGGKGRRAALTAFALTALPFVVLEAATGIVSLFTTLLSIPPVLGAGTAVDVGILVAGVAMAGYRGARAAPP